MHLISLDNENDKKMNLDIKFSVLMSVYHKDSPEFFDLALRSVTVEQTLRPSQMVIVEDGPVPAQMEDVITTVNGEVPEIEFTVLRRAQNKGLAVSLNEGLRECKYDWVARMDSDDISVPERFEKEFGFIQANDFNIDIVGSYIDEFSEQVGDITSIRTVGTTQDEIKRMSKKRTPFNHMSVIFNKTSVEKAGCYSEDFGKLEDYKLWVDMLSKGARAANIPEILVHVRVGNGFIERRSNKREIQDWDMLQQYLLKGGIVTKGEALMNKLYIRVFIYTPSFVKKFLYKYMLRKK